MLGERLGDKSDSRFCGVETEFQEDMPQLLSFNLSSSAAFDFVVAPVEKLALGLTWIQKIRYSGWILKSL